MSSFRAWLQETGSLDEGPKGMWSAKEYSDLALQLDSLDRTEISSAVITHSSSTPAALHARALEEKLEGRQMIRSVNQELRSWEHASDRRLLATAWVDPRLTESALEEVERASQGTRPKAISMLTAYPDGDGGLRFLDDPVFTPVLALAAELEMPVFVHAGAKLDLQAGTRPKLSGIEGAFLTGGIAMPIETTLCAVRLIVGGTLERHAGLRIVLGQLGGILPFLLGRFDLIELLLSQHLGQTNPTARPREHSQVLRNLREYTDQLYVDTHSMDGPAIECALEALGPERVLFGSDFPITPERLGRLDGISLIRSMGLGAETEEDLLVNNANRLLGLVPPAQETRTERTKETSKASSGKGSGSKPTDDYTGEEVA